MQVAINRSGKPQIFKINASVLTCKSNSGSVTKQAAHTAKAAAIVCNIRKNETKIRMKIHKTKTVFTALTTAAILKIPSPNNSTRYGEFIVCCYVNYSEGNNKPANKLMAHVIT